MKYHYSYFIYPFLVKNYNKYIRNLMASPKYTPKFFEPAKDVSIYNYFLPTIKDYMFKSFGFSKTSGASITHEKLKDNSFKSSPCAMFTYKIGEDAQAKTGEDDGIFFKIDKMEVICFKTGICFLVMKTNIQGSDKFSDFLNFNAKFREINSEIEGYDPYSNIKIQTSTFDDIKRLSDLIREITGGVSLSKKIDIDINKFLVYSYVCVDQEYWNEGRSFSVLEKEFYKFANVLNSDFNSSFDNDRLEAIDFGRYIKVRS